MKEQPITNNFQFSSPCDPPLLHPSCSDPGPLEEDHHNHRAGLRVVSVSRTGHVETKSMGTEGIQGGNYIIHGWNISFLTSNIYIMV